MRNTQYGARVVAVKLLPRQFHLCPRPRRSPLLEPRRASDSLCRPQESKKGPRTLGP